MNHYIYFVTKEKHIPARKKDVLMLSLGRAALRRLHQRTCARSRVRVKFSFNGVKKTSERHYKIWQNVQSLLGPPRIATVLYIPVKLSRKHPSTFPQIIHLSTKTPVFTKISTRALLAIWCGASFAGGRDAANDRISKRWRTAPGALHVPVNPLQISTKVGKL